MKTNHCGLGRLWTSKCAKYLPLGLTLLFLLPFPIDAQYLPAGTAVEARLLTAIGSRISQVGERIEALTIAPVSLGGQVFIPDGSRLFGSVGNVKRLGLGLRHLTAEIQFQFDALRLPNGKTIPIHAKLFEVETAKERVDIDGVVRGIHPSASLSASVSLVTTPLLFAAPAIGAPIWVAKSVILPPARPEIYLPTGTELILKLAAPIKVRWTTERPPDLRSFSQEELGEVHQLSDASAQRARMGTHSSDILNVIFVGSRQEIDRAFHAAGWVQADRKSVMSLYRMYNALEQRIGYRKAPMNALTLNGAPSDFVYQKGLDTVERRHHVRLWKAPQTADVWFGTAAEDVGFRFKLGHWTHATDPNIDNERAKVVNDLAFTGCLEAAGLLARDSADLRYDPKAERLILTDNGIATVRLNSCMNPRTMPGVDTATDARERSRTSHIFASLRNDLRLNLLFTTYNALKLLAGYRALKPLTNPLAVDVKSPGLDWLSSLTTERSISSAGTSSGVPVQ